MLCLDNKVEVESFDFLQPASLIPPSPSPVFNPLSGMRPCGKVRKTVLNQLSHICQSALYTEKHEAMLANCY